MILLYFLVFSLGKEKEHSIVYTNPSIDLYLREEYLESMKKGQQGNLSTVVYKAFKEEILNGTLKGGEKITEETLAKRFGVSRTPIREAIRRLSDYGLVTIKPRCYAEICAISPKEALDIAKVRIALETLAIDEITPARYEAHMKTIARYAAECQYDMSIGNRAAAFEQDSLFHLAIIEASENEVLHQTYERLDAKIQQLRIAQQEPEPILNEYLNQHNQIMRLLHENRKDECKALIYKHILHS